MLYDLSSCLTLAARLRSRNLVVTVFADLQFKCQVTLSKLQIDIAPWNKMMQVSIQNPQQHFILHESHNFPLFYSPLSSPSFLALLIGGNRSLIQSVQCNNCQRLFKVSYPRRRGKEQFLLPKISFFLEFCLFIARLKKGIVTPWKKHQRACQHNFGH